jgi:superfamily I DNA/RNA helicase
MTKFAKPEEIQHAHLVLLKDKPYFEQDKIDIIECNESKDVKACPGSGKTTTLLAKLIILANRMPLPNNQGICVLTHTNVAIDEIKNKLGHKANILFRYPNHFGTIQSFVDKFLAIPYFSALYQKKPSQISNDAYLKNLDRSFRMKLGSIKKSNEPLQKRMYYFFLTNNGLLNNIRLIIKDSDFQLIDISNNSEISFNKPRKGKNYTDWSEEEKKEMKTLTMDIIKNVYKYYSTINYHDAYTFSTAYILDMPEIKQAISSRFKYLFIDEMQDTDSHQLDIINTIFDSKKTVIQCFGDHHQAIFNKIKSDELWQPKNTLEITTDRQKI